MTKIILATTSPYRIEAFKFLGINFVAEGSKVDESLVERTDPEKLVSVLSKMKAEAVSKNHSDATVIGMDSVGCFNGKILEKPKSREEGFARLVSLSENCFQFYTGIYMINTADKKELSRVVITDACFRKINESEINQYLNEDPNFMTYALGFDSLGHFSSTFISKIEGSYNNVLRGIPLEVIVEMLYNMGYKTNKRA
ncbi:MAG: Maf family nucleotide pyrophosphatase [bacterium]